MKKQNINNESSFFKFEKIGTSVEGNFKGFKTSKFGLVMQVSNYYVDLSKASLKQLIKDNLHLLTVGKKVRIDFTATKKIKGQTNPVKIFRIFVNNEELHSSFVLKDAMKKDISGFFEENK